MFRVDIQKVKMEWLSVDCLVTLSKYVQVAHDDDGIVLPLQSDNLLKLVVHHVKRTENTELHELYNELKIKIKAALADPRLKGVMTSDVETYDIELKSSVEYADFAA